MELLYLYIDDYFEIKQCGFNFSSRYHVTEVVEDHKLTIRIEENGHHVAGYFSEPILNVAAIIGRNGAGKSNLMYFLTRLLTNSTMRIYYGLQFAAVFQNGDQIVCFHTLFETRHENMTTIYENEWKVELTSETLAEDILSVNKIEIETSMHDEPVDVAIPGMKNNQVIYYNPIFDLRDIPSHIDYDSKEEIDVSTNALIEKDAKDIANDEYSQVEKHKMRNTERQFDTIFDQHIDFSQVNLPVDIEIKFTRASVNSRNLNPRNARIFEHISNVLARSFYLENQDDPVARRRGHLITSFYDALIFNFFDAVAHHEQWQQDLLQIQEGRFEDKPAMENYEQLYEYIASFFAQQQFIDFGVMMAMIDYFIETIYHPDVQKSSSENGVYYVSQVQALGGWNIHKNYLAELDYQYPFINLSWRNISSGEKAYLDMYARLHYAETMLYDRREKLTAEQQQEPFTLYLLIDEAEVGFHPVWQQAYFDRLQQYVIQLFGRYPAKIQLFATSHSPFLLSDLPASNVILMDKIDGKVITYGNLADSRQTLGANILSLFDDSFFLPKGAIGEYARKKIDHFITSINSKDQEISLEKSEVFISAIGDPFLRKVLRDQLNSRRSLSNTIEELEQELLRLKQIRDDQNNPG